MLRVSYRYERERKREREKERKREREKEREERKREREKERQHVFFVTQQNTTKYYTIESFNRMRNVCEHYKGLFLSHMPISNIR